MALTSAIAWVALRRAGKARGMVCLLTGLLCGATGHSAVSAHEPPIQPGRDAFHCVPEFSGEDGDAVERVPTVFRAGEQVRKEQGASRGLADKATAELAGGASQPAPLAAGWRREPLGPSSRRTGLVISEIMYHPRDLGGDTNDLLEFIEFYNAQPFDEDLGGYRVSGEVAYTFPNNTVLRARNFLVLARAPVLVRNYYGIGGVCGPWNVVSTNDPMVSLVRLSNRQGTVRLQDQLGAVLLEVTYQDQPPWPLLADGKGYSLVLARPSCGEASPAAWSAGARLDGSPGQDEPATLDRLRQVVINELLAHSVLPQLDFIELHNTSTQDLDISGCGLSDSPSAVKFVFRGALIPAGGYLALDEYILGFALPAEGDTLYFTSPTGTILEAVRYGPQAAGTSWGRVPDGGPEFHPLAPPTPFAANLSVAGGPVVINEIMYAPLSGDSDDEYVELHNRSTNAVDISGWQLSDAIGYTFRPGTVIPAGGYLVVARRMAQLLTRYPGLLTPANTVGDFGGNLANEGERVILLRPEPLGVNGVTNLYPVVADEVEYRTGGRWGRWANGGGSSLELIDPRSDNRLAANWADSDETTQGAWTHFEFTGTIDHVDSALGANDTLQVFLLGVGEALVDDIEVLTTNGVNLLGASGTFETGLSGWTPQGSHDLSSLESTGYESGHSLHVRAASPGDPEANRVCSPKLNPPAQSNAVVTLRAKARWVRGFPEVLIRLRGGGLEAVGRLPTPAHLGTPGARNSRAVPNAGPAIWDVTHHPALPAADEAVVVTARVSDPDGISSVALIYRVDVPGGVTNVVPLLDDGTGGDLWAGDGLLSAIIPGQPSGTGVAFYLEAADGSSHSATSLFPPDVFPPAGLDRVFPMDAPTRECVVRFGEPSTPGAFGAYHLWLTSGNSNRWHTRAPLSRALVDATLVCGSGRVIYNVGARFAGGAGQVQQMRDGPAGPLRCDYHVVCPDDDRCLGAAELDWLNPGQPVSGLCSDPSGQVERLCHVLLREMSLHHNPRRFVHVWVNGLQRSLSTNLPGQFVMEDVWQPDLKTLQAHYADDPPADFYEVQNGFESDDTGTVFHGHDAQLTRCTTSVAGVAALKLAPYRFTWRKSGCLPWQSASDYQTLLSVIEAVSPPGSAGDDTSTFPDVASLDRVIDLEEWMRVLAVQHAVGNREAYGYARGQNAYAYRGSSAGSRVTLIARDFDLALGVGGDGASAGLFIAQDPRVVGMFRTPEIRRMYLRALFELVQGPFRNEFLDPMLDAAAAAFDLEGVSYSPATHATIKAYVGARRAYLLGQLAGLTNAFTATVQRSNNLALVTGTASVAVKEIRVNGVLHPITWASDGVHFSIVVPLVQGTNDLAIWGLDRLGQAIPGASVTRTLVYSEPGYRPEDGVVISELMYRPALSGASYIEIQNLATNFYFDLSGWRLAALDYTFRLGTTLAPRSFLVLAKNRAAFAAAYGDASRVFDEFSGDFDPLGETVALVIPGLAPGEDVVVDRVRYEAALPWGPGANGSGAALQLIDPTVDNARVSNWSDGSGWRHFSLTGTLQYNGTNLYIWMAGPGDVYLDDVRLVHGPTPGLETNLVQNGGFEDPFENGWSFRGTNLTHSAISTDLAHSGNASLHVVSTGAGGTGKAIVQLLPFQPTNLTCTLSFWYYTNPNGTNLIVRTHPGSDLNSSVNVRPVNLTPGASNAVAASLPPYPELWLNEVQPDNRNGPADSFGDRDPWIELYNAGPELIELGACYLANNYTNLTPWRFPADAFILPGQALLVWADSEPEESGPGEWHTSFALDRAGGSVALVRLVDGQPQVMDYLNYTALGPDQSYGDYPDGQPFERRIFHLPTPGLNNFAPPVQVVINEWIASNVGPSGYADPADNDYEDWIELYNRGSEDANLSGFYLTDTLPSPLLWRIPDGTVIPAGGFLLVWADGEPGQNGLGSSGDLHAGFKLNNGGEAIGLSRVVGTNVYLIDGVTFSRQYDNVSQGRFADGSSEFHLMTQPTPRAPNVPGNSLPVISSVYYGGLVSLGQTFRLPLTATDPDAPPQMLTFSLVAAPSGATIDPRNGLFTFVPTEAPALVYVTVQVSDDGQPPARTTRSFHIHVGLPSPATIQGPSPEGQIRLSFDTIEGGHYRVEYKTDLSEPVWTTWGDNLLAEGPSLFLEETILQSPQRFYRVIRLD